MIVLIVVAGALAAAFIARPRLALGVALAFPAVQIYYSPPLLRVTVLLLLCVALLVVLRTATPGQRDLLGRIWLGVTLTLTLGWALAPEPSLAQGMVVNLVYATVLASLAVVFRMTGTEWSLYLMAWGCLVSAWLVTQDVVTTGRTGAVYLGENANTLGMFAALGFVGAFVLAARKPFRPLLALLLAPIGAVCLLGVVSSASRGALVVIAAGMGIRLLAPLLRASTLRAVAGAALLGLGILWASVPVLTWFLERSGRQIEATGDFGSRQQILADGLRTGFEHFFTGAGFASLEVDGIGLQGTVSAHNAFVGLFAAVGIIPTVLLLLLILRALLRARRSPDRALLPLIVAAVVVGLSLDWVPTAKLGPVVLALVVCGAALPQGATRCPSGPNRGAPPGTHSVRSEKVIV